MQDPSNSESAGREDRSAGATLAAPAPVAAAPRDPRSPWMAGRLESFVYSVSHDLGAPVRAVAVSLDLIAKRHTHQLEPRAAELFRVALEGSVKLQRMIERLVIVSRVRRHMQPSKRVDLDDVLAGAVAAHRSEIDALAMLAECDSLPAVSGDARLLAMMFAELVGNAVKFCRHDGDPWLEIKAVPQQRHILIVIRDNGIGVPANKAAQIFEPFARLHSDDDYPGLGLGLTLCREVAEVHGGFIYAYPNPAPEQGLTVVVGLPLRETAP